MTRMFLALTTLFALAIAPAKAADPPKVEGDWEGSLKVTADISIRIVYHVKKEADGSYTATMDSPDQGAKGIKVESAKYEKDTLTLSSPMINATYVGKVDAAGKKIAGTFTQLGKDLPLTLVPAADVALGKPDMMWEGKLKVNGGIELRLVLNLFKQKDGAFKATLDSPDQGVNGIKVDTVSLDKDTLSFAVKLI